MCVIREEEELKRVPYEEEIRLCDFLISYLESKFLNSSSAAKDDALSSSAPAPVFKFAGMTLMQRSNDDYVVLGNASQKKGKKKGGSNTKDTIAHSVDTINSFSSLEINYPRTTADVPEALTFLREKKSFYQSQPRGSVPTLESRQKGEVDRDLKASAGTGGSDKQKKRDFISENNDTEFPSL